MRPGPSYSAGPAASPFDGFVHQVKEVAADQRARSRTIMVRCGATMPTCRSYEPLAGASVWGSCVTCPACKPTQKEPLHAQ